MITPNQLTAFRILIAIICPFLLIWNRSFLGESIVFVAFTVACITDWWDGHLARTKSMVTWEGKIADPIADKLLILGLMATFSFLKLYSFWWVVPIFVRELTVTTVRLIRLKQGRVIPAEMAGKVKAGVQITSIYFTLWFLMFMHKGFSESQSFLFSLLQVLHYSGIFLANVITIISGVMFFYRLNKA